MNECVLVCWCVCVCGPEDDCKLVLLGAMDPGGLQGLCNGSCDDLADNAWAGVPWVKAFGSCLETQPAATSPAVAWPAGSPRWALLD